MTLEGREEHQCGPIPIFGPGGNPEKNTGDTGPQSLRISKRCHAVLPCPRA